jgi:membrane-bound metal-dependent hydrolase YbcI (DUF457 family)
LLAVLFPTHLLAGYLLGRRWTRLPVWAAGGAALPDLVDKPLGLVGATELYHSVGHSLLPVLGLALAWLLARRVEGPDDRLLAVGLGCGSHICLDVLGIAVNGRSENWVLLLWPIREKPNPLGLDPVAFSVEYLWSWSFYAEIVVWVVGAYVLLQSPAARRYARSWS